MPKSFYIFIHCSQPGRSSWRVYPSLFLFSFGYDYLFFFYLREKRNKKKGNLLSERCGTTAAAAGQVSIATPCWPTTNCKNPTHKTNKNKICRDISFHFFFFFFFSFLIIPPRQPKLQTMSIILIGSMLFWVSNSFLKKERIQVGQGLQEKNSSPELRRCGLLSLIIYHQQRCHSVTEKSFVTFTIQKVTCVYSRRKEFRFFFVFGFIRKKNF